MQGGDPGGHDQHGWSPEHPGVDATDLRWPGYLGRSYGPGGVLCVATIHRDFASGGVGPEIRDSLVTGTRQQWKDERVSDAEYLSVVRRCYTHGLNRWTVGTNLGAALRLLGVGIEEICYTNAARCQYPEIEPKAPDAGAIKLRLVKLCLGRFPIAELAKADQASTVLFTNVTAYDQVAPTLPDEVTPVSIHQWLARGRAPLTRPLTIDGTTWPVRAQVAEWAPALKAQIEHNRPPAT